jgi:hypothetical protein
MPGFSCITSVCLVIFTVKFSIHEYCGGALACSIVLVWDAAVATQRNALGDAYQ